MLSNEIAKECNFLESKHSKRHKNNRKSLTVLEEKLRLCGHIF